MTLEFTLQELKHIDAGIRHLPYYIAVPLFESINKQIAEQESKIHNIDDLSIIEPSV